MSKPDKIADVVKMVAKDDPDVKTWNDKELLLAILQVMTEQYRAGDF